MKIRMRRNKLKGTASISFRAESDAEGVALKNAIMAVAREGGDNGIPAPARIVEELHKNGVEKADFDLKIVEPRRRKTKAG